MAGVIGLDNELELELELASEYQEALAISCWSSVLEAPMMLYCFEAVPCGPGGQFKRRLNRSCLGRHVRFSFPCSCLHNSGNIKRRHRKTLQPLQGHEELAILRRHLSKVARNYDYVRARTASGVQQEVVEGRGVQLG
ncbi:hypothetical protein ACLKA7_009825 [Drosophila subpalustris]